MPFACEKDQSPKGGDQRLHAAHASLFPRPLQHRSKAANAEFAQPSHQLQLKVDHHPKTKHLFIFLRQLLIIHQTTISGSF
jgi:hypothetical protein